MEKKIYMVGTGSSQNTVLMQHNFYLNYKEVIYYRTLQTNLKCHTKY